MSYKNLKNLFEEQSLINDISGILNWDMATYMPENSRRQRIKQITKLYDYKKNIFNLIKKNDFFHLKKALLPAKYRVEKYGN